jgi:hypothetical protein
MAVESITVLTRPALPLAAAGRDATVLEPGMTPTDPAPTEIAVELVGTLLFGKNVPLSRKLVPPTLNPPTEPQAGLPPVDRHIVVATWPDSRGQLTSTPCEPLTVIGADAGLASVFPPKPS